MHVRSATIQDIPLLNALAHAIWKSVYPGIISAAQIEYMLETMYNPAQIEAEMAAGHVWKLAQEETTGIGFISTHVESPAVMKVSKLYLDPAYHGKGYGQRLLMDIEDDARKAGVDSIYLYVNRSNARALQAYRRAGYEIVQSLDQKFGNFVLNDYKLSKRIR